LSEEMGGKSFKKPELILKGRENLGNLQKGALLYKKEVGTKITAPLGSLQGWKQ